jgi:hypothetical protein
MATMGQETLLDVPMGKNYHRHPRRPARRDVPGASARPAPTWDEVEAALCRAKTRHMAW